MGKSIALDVRTDFIIRQVKQLIYDAEGIPTHHQHLTYNGKDLENNRPLCYYGIDHNATLIVRKINVDNVTHYVVDPENLDPEYDCDFTNIKDEGAKFVRGGLAYKRPAGWKRYALKVLGKYENDAWLGAGTNGNEWPVSYHGTAYCNANSIADNGYSLKKGKNFAYGHGTYSTPNIHIAEKYAKEFVFKGETYLVVLQNRVNPKNLKRIKTYMGEYWISPKGEDLRVYGICIKKKERFAILRFIWQQIGIMGFLVLFAWEFPVIQASVINTQGFRSIVIQSPVEAESFKIGSTHVIKWKSTLPPNTEVVIEILASPRYELEPPEMIWKTTAV
ncbi:6628_t:CDS:2, partial [Acaulospora colombiana]